MSNDLDDVRTVTVDDCGRVVCEIRGMLDSPFVLRRKHLISRLSYFTALVVEKASESPLNAEQVAVLAMSAIFLNRRA